jgi:choline dehydrogenase-like flavoprotein
VRDVIVVGAGGGGAVAAKELAARGLDVLLLEAGPRWSHTERSWTHYEADANNPASGFFRFGPSERSKPPWARDLPQYCFLWQTAGVGGSTVHYFGNCPRAMPGVFAGYAGADAAAYDTAHRFPFGYAELVPYYEWVEHTLPVQTAPMGTKEQVFLRGATRLGLPPQTGKDVSGDSCRAQENAILQPAGTAGKTRKPARLRYPKARGCTFCGHCLEGCIEPRGAPRNLRAKRSADTSYVPMALTAGRWTHGRSATLVADAFVLRVETDAGGARGVTWRSTRTGETHTEEATVVVLAGGCVETPRLWLRSGLPNPNDLVGRGLSDHYPDFVIGRMPFYTGSTRGPGSNARADFPGLGSLEVTTLPPGLQAYALAFSDSGMAGLYDNGTGISAQGADVIGRLVGTRLKAFLADVDRLLNVLVLTDDDVEPQNRVTLSRSAAPDEHGAVARVEVPYRRRSARTTRNRELLARKAVELLRAAGASEVARMNIAPVLFHLHATMRMGASPSDSVVDPNGESWSVPRLFVADTSALSNGVGGANPTLTAQALATRTAERIFTRCFSGTPWVGRESPVSSIDRAVTRAVKAARL